MTICPKCGYARKASESAPDWQCPGCGIAYAKFHAAPPPVAAVVAPAEAPVHRGLLGAKPASSEDDDSPLYDRGPGVLIGILLMVPGIYFLLRGFDVIHTPGRPEWTDPGTVMLGATLCSAGAWFVVAALDLSRRATRATGLAIWACLALVYTWGIFIAGFEALAYTSMGPMSGTQFWRALVVAFDLYVALSVFDNVLEELSSAPPAKRNKYAYAVGCIVMVFTLELTGGLAKIYAGLGMKLPGPAATIGLLQSNHFHPAVPDLPLEEFAGDWYGVFHKRMPQNYARGKNTISRVHVSVANGEARMRLWRSCPPQECDGGTFPAIIESRRRGTVVALHVTGTMDGTDWLMTLSTQKDHMLLEEQHIRGRDMNTRYQFSDWMSRQKP